MCAIVGSFDRDKLIELIELNSYRGSHSYSFSLYDTYLNRLTVIKREVGEIDKSIINIPNRCYGIAHIQAPTTEARDDSAIHPALAEMESFYTVSKDTVERSYRYALWHNGILKSDFCKKLQERHGLINWDTNLLLCELLSDGFHSLDKIDGSFSCLFYANGTLHLFRNEISPMFVDKELNMSSTKFDGSEPTQPNKVLKVELHNKTIAPIISFKTVENPYFFGDDV